MCIPLCEIRLGKGGWKVDKFEWLLAERLYDPPARRDGAVDSDGPSGGHEGYAAVWVLARVWTLPQCCLLSMLQNLPPEQSERVLCGNELTD